MASFREMATLFQMNMMETELVVHHNELVRSLELRYANHISKLLHQKSMILNKLQEQFIKQRIKLREKLSMSSLMSFASSASMPSHPSSSTTFCSVTPIIGINERMLLNHNVHTQPQKIEISNNNQNDAIKMKTDESSLHLDLPKIDFAEYKDKAKEKEKAKNNQKKKRKESKKRYSCPYCEYTSDRSSNVKVHIRTHTKERPFACPFANCETRFTTKGSMDRHVKRHNNVRNHKCSYCERAFVTKNEMARHERTHSGEKPYECGKCQKLFATNSGLAQHLRMHHPKDNHKK